MLIIIQVEFSLSTASLVPFLFMSLMKNICYTKLSKKKGRDVSTRRGMFSMVRYQIYAYLRHSRACSVWTWLVHKCTSSFNVSQVGRIIENTDCPRVFNLRQRIDIHYALFCEKYYNKHTFNYIYISHLTNFLVLFHRDNKPRQFRACSFDEGILWKPNKLPTQHKAHANELLMAFNGMCLRICWRTLANSFIRMCARDKQEKEPIFKLTREA